MKKILLLLLSTLSLSVFAQDNINKHFVIEEISSQIFSRIKGLSYKDNCTIPLSELRYLRVLHFDIDGKSHQGELICNKAIANDLIEVFKVLYKAKYPIQRMELIDNYGADDTRSMLANNSSAFNFRYIANTKKLSNHSWGLAIDINPLYNPYVKESNGKLIIDPKESAAYVDRKKEFPYKIDHNDLCYKEMVKRGFT